MPFTFLFQYLLFSLWKLSCWHFKERLHSKRVTNGASFSLSHAPRDKTVTCGTFRERFSFRKPTALIAGFRTRKGIWSINYLGHFNSNSEEVRRRKRKRQNKTKIANYAPVQVKSQIPKFYPHPWYLGDCAPDQIALCLCLLLYESYSLWNSLGSQQSYIFHNVL